MQTELLTDPVSFDGLREAPAIQCALQESHDAETGDFEKMSFRWVE
jgi:hypothetical protein